MTIVPEEKKFCIFLIAGEASGDVHGANLVKAIKERRKNIFFSGIGGKAMLEAGVEIVVDSKTLSVVGITEIFSKLPGIIHGLSVAKKNLKDLKPDLLILIDFPDFNLRIAAEAKKSNIPVLYYISPQIWAWRSGRVKKIGRLTDHVAVILPFEEHFYKNHGIPATFVGHPLLDEYMNHHFFSSKNTLTAFPKVIGLLPGSRESEISRHLPVMLDAARILSVSLDEVSFIVSVAPGASRDVIETICSPYRNVLSIEMDDRSARSVFPKTHLVVAASGTVTLEAVISRTPVVIIYKVSPLSYWLGKALIKVKHIGLVNLIAGKEIVPELIQDSASPENIADTVLNLINTPAAMDSMQNAFCDARKQLGEPGASGRVADIALRIIGARK